MSWIHHLKPDTYKFVDMPTNRDFFYTLRLNCVRFNDFGWKHCGASESTIGLTNIRCCGQVYAKAE